MSVEGQMTAAERAWMRGWEEGPRRTRWSGLPVQVGDPAPAGMTVDSAQRSVELAEFWAGQPALLLFWRHYGCGCGMERAERLVDELDAYREAGARVAVIGQAEPERSAAYGREHGLDEVTILCDPEFELYEAYGLLEGKPSQIVYDAPDPFLRGDLEAARELAESRRDQGRPLVDNGWLLPGEFVVDPRGTLQLTYRYQYCDNFPDPRVLVAAIREARGDFE